MGQADYVTIVRQNPASSRGITERTMGKSRTNGWVTAKLKLLADFYDYTIFLDRQIERPMRHEQ
jgi:hypothetical protein